MHMYLHAHVPVCMWMYLHAHVRTCVIIVGLIADFPQLPSMEQPAWGEETGAEHILY